MLNNDTNQNAFWDSMQRARGADFVQRRFWPKIKRLVASLPFTEELLAAYYCAFDRGTPRHVRIALIGALTYFIMPSDTMPDILPLLGFTDDAAVLAAAIRLVSTHIRDEHRAAANQKLFKLKA